MTSVLPTAPDGRRAIVASGTWIALSTLLPFLATAVLSVVAGRVLGAELLGQQSLIAFAGTLASALLLNSLTDACIRFLSAYRSSDPGRVARLERWTLRAHLAAGCVTATVLAAIGVVHGEHVHAWLLLALVLPLDAVSWGWACRIIAHHGWGVVARRRLISQLVAIGLGIAAVLAGAGIEGIFAANVVAAAVLLLMLRPLARRPRVRLLGRKHDAVVALWATFALTLVLRQLISGRAEVLALGAWSSGAQIAQYTVAVMLVTSAMVLPAAVASAAMPALAAASGAGDRDRTSQATARAMRITAVVSLPLTALVAATGPSLLVALYGPDFAEAGRLSRWVAVLVLAVPCGQLASSYWSGLGRLRLPVLAAVIGAVLDLVVCVVLIPERGAEGAVVATVLGQGAAAIVLVLLTWRSLGRPSLGGRGLVSGLVASALAATAGSAAAFSGLLGTVVAGVVVVVVFVPAAAGLAAVGLPLLSRDDADWLRGAFPSRLRMLVSPLARR